MQTGPSIIHSVHLSWSLTLDNRARDSLISRAPQSHTQSLIRSPRSSFIGVVAAVSSRVDSGGVCGGNGGEFRWAEVRVCMERHEAEMRRV